MTYLVRVYISGFPLGKPSDRLVELRKRGNVPNIVSMPVDRHGLGS